MTSDICHPCEPGWHELQARITAAAWQWCGNDCRAKGYADPCENCLAGGHADVGWFNGMPVPPPEVT